MTTYSQFATPTGYDSRRDSFEELNDDDALDPSPGRNAAHNAQDSSHSVWDGIFAHPNVALSERIVSGVAGAAMAGYAITKKRDMSGAALALAGGFLLYRSLTGQCMGYTALRTGTADPNTNATIAHGRGIKVEKTVAIMKDRQELYDFWRSLDNLPRFMRHLQSVTVTDANYSHWVAAAPLGKTVEWDAEVINEIPGELIAWRSVEGADIPNAGSVRFKTLPAGRGTQVTVNLEYDPPAGILGSIVAKLFGEEPNQQVRDDLRRFKNLMEAGEVPTVEGQPQGNEAGHTTNVGPMRTNA